MVDVKLRYVNGFKPKNKKRSYYYFRRNGITHPLPEDPSSAKFMAEYNRLLQETQPDAVPRKVTPAEGTFAALALAYYASPQFKRRSDGTKKAYRAIIDAFVKEHGKRRVDQLRRSNITKIIGDMSDTPGAANNLVRVLRILMSFAVNQEIIAVNPVSKTAMFEVTEHHTWTEDQLMQFEKHWPLGTRERLVFDALLYTGQRISDVCRMSLPDASGKIRLVQKKTGTSMVLSVHPRLARSIKACPSGQLTMIPSRSGKPLTANRLSIMMYQAIDAAGLPDECVAHGLRKAFARRLAETGSTPSEIMASTGHKTLSEVEKYTRAAEQEKLNESAMQKQVRKQKRNG